MTPFLDVGACVLLTVSGQVRFDDVGWRETVRAEVVAVPGCTSLDLVLPDGVELADWSIRVRPDVDRRYALGPERLITVDQPDNGTRRMRWLVPELEEGDALDLVLERLWTRPVDFVWTPGRDHAGFAELELPRGLQTTRSGVAVDGRTAWVAAPDPTVSVVLTHPWADRAPPLPAPTDETGLSVIEARARVVPLTVVAPAWFGRAPVVGQAALDLGAADHRGLARTLVALTTGGPDHVEIAQWSPAPDLAPAVDAPEAAVWWSDDGPRVLVHPALGGPAGAWHAASGVVRAGHIVPLGQGAPPVANETVDVTVQVQGRRPLARLRPDGGLVYTEVHHLSWTDDARARATSITLPADTRAVHDITCDHHRSTDAALWLVAAAGTATCSYAVDRPLVDAWGPLDVPADHATITATWVQPDGTRTAGDAVIERGAWRIATLAGEPLLASRERLQAELWARFVDASLPEPGLAVASKSGRRGWEFAALLRDLVLERVTVAPLAVPPTRPRPLLKARKGRAVTEAEAAMLGALYARQAHLAADPYLVRTVSQGPLTGLAPVDFDAALVRVEHESRGGWVDIACTVCGPFEVRPELLGGAALGRVFEQIPAPPVVDGLPAGVHDDGRTWQLDATVHNGVGSWTVEERILGDEISASPGAHWTLTGADALDLRRRLEALPAAARGGWLADHVDARAPQDMTFSGIELAGAPVTLEAPTREPFAVDPIALPWGGVAIGWLGVRTWSRPAPPGAEPAVWTCPDTSPRVAWRAQVHGRELVEQLLVRAPRLTAADAALIRACRSRLAGPPDVADDQMP